MGKDCAFYQAKGTEAALLAGYNSQERAACNIQAIQKGLPRPGTPSWKPSGGRRRHRSTRNRRNKNRSTRNRR